MTKLGETLIASAKEGIALAKARAVPEWIGKTPDTPVPPRVRLRVFLANHARCQDCTRNIYPTDKWECDHTIALVNGGENRESNLQTLCEECHDRKSKGDVAEKSTAYRHQLAHRGIKTARWPPLPGSRRSGLKRKMNGEVVKREKAA